MKIAVCVKQVPESAKRIDPVSKRLDRSGEGTLNAFDAHAVEEGLRLRDTAGGEVVVLSLGPAKAGDSDGAVLWAALADRLRLPLISQVGELTSSNGNVRGKRQTEFGYDVIEAPLPAVLAVSDAINEPRYPSLKGIMGAKRKPQETLGVTDLGISPDEVGEAGSRTTVLALGDPPPRGEARRIEDDGTAAEQIVEYLVAKRLL